MEDNILYEKYVKYKNKYLELKTEYTKNMSNTFGGSKKKKCINCENCENCKNCKNC
jgi:hypothetical protein